MTPEAAIRQGDGLGGRPRVPRVLRAAIVAAWLVGLAALVGGAGAPAATVPGSPRLFASWSPLNQPIPAGAAVDRRSPVMVQELVDEANEKGWAIATHEWTAAIYHAGPKTRRYSVPLDHNSYGARVAVGVPIPARAVAPPDEDGQMIVIDDSTHCLYDFGRAVRSGGRWAAAFVNALSTDGSGIYRNANSPSASGFSYAAGKILPQELEAGHIAHALTFTMHRTKAGGAVWPATGSDGTSLAPGAIPEGARVQLDPSLNLDQFHLTPWQRTIAEALQQYGMFLYDTGGALALNAQSDLSTAGEYPWGNVDYAYMPTALVPYLRVLRLGRQFPNVYKLQWRNSCITIR
jgi:hypothetical protein